MPPGVVTLIVPVVPLPTVALMVVAFVTVKVVAAVPPKLTPGRPGEVGAGDGHHRARASAGRGERRDGRRGMQVKLPAAGGRAAGRGDADGAGRAVPTVAAMVVALITVKVSAAVPPKVTAVAPVKLVPVMVTTVPVPPLVGVNDVMVGGG